MSIMKLTYNREHIPYRYIWSKVTYKHRKCVCCCANLEIIWEDINKFSVFASFFAWGYIIFASSNPTKNLFLKMCIQNGASFLKNLFLKWFLYPRIITVLQRMNEIKIFTCIHFKPCLHKNSETSLKPSRICFLSL